MDVCVYAHMHAHACTHAFIQVRAQTTHMHTHVRTLKHMQAPMYTHRMHNRDIETTFLDACVPEIMLCLNR